MDKFVSSNNGSTVALNGVNGHADIDRMVAENLIRPPEPERPARRFQPLSLADLLKLPPKEWIINQVMGSGDLIMVYGAPGTGKTFVVVDMIFAACLGRKWAMRFDVPRRLNVAYCAGEGVSGLPARFGAAAQFYGVESMENFTFYSVTPSLFYDDSQKNDIESIDRFILEWKERQDAGEAQLLDILVIDTLHSATAGCSSSAPSTSGPAML